MSSFVADLSPFRVPAFRRYLLGSSLGFTSLWMYMTVAAWMLLEENGSAQDAGLLLTAMTIPVPFAMLAAGPLTDRLGPRTIVSAGFLVQGLAALATTLLVVTGNVSVPLVLAFALVLGTADGFVIVSSQVLAGRAVDASAMAAAVTLGMLAIGVGRIIGAPIGGAVTATAGPAAGLLLAGLGFLSGAALIATMPRLSGIGGGARLRLADLREGLAWVRTTRIALITIAFGGVAALFLWPYLGLLAPHARDVLDGDSATLGLIAAAGGLGSIIAAIGVGAVARSFGSMTVLTLAVLGGGLLLAAFGLVSWVPASMVVSMFLSMALLSIAAMGSLILQSSAPLELRGRVLAINGFVIFGFMPFSMAIAGSAADRWGVTAVMVAMGALAVGLGLAVFLVGYRRRWVPRLFVAVPPVETPTPVEPPA